MKPPAIQFATLFDVIGRPRMMDEILFVPALLEIEAPAEGFHETIEEYFNSAVDGPAPKIGEGRSWHYGTWLRARIPRVFEFRPALCLGNVQDLLDVGFLAVSKFSRRSLLTAYPFACVNSVCWDDYGPENTAGLLFSRGGPSSAIRDRVTRAFWRLLRRDTGDLEPFEDYDYFRQEIIGLAGQDFLDPGCDGNFGGYDEIDPHCFLHGEKFPCCDCDGCGIEYEFPYTEDCATCGGQGYITWRFGRSTRSNRWDETAW